MNCCATCRHWRVQTASRGRLGLCVHLTCRLVTARAPIKDFGTGAEYILSGQIVRDLAKEENHVMTRCGEACPGWKDMA